MFKEHEQMKLIDLTYIHDIDSLSRELTNRHTDSNLRLFNEGAYIINKTILIQIEEFYYYDEYRSTTHKSHEAYKKQFGYFLPHAYLVHYLTGYGRDKVNMSLLFLPNFKDPVLYVKNILNPQVQELNSSWFCEICGGKPRTEYKYLCDKCREKVDSINPPEYKIRF